MAYIKCGNNIFSINLSTKINNYDFINLITVSIIFKMDDIEISESDHYMERDDINNILKSFEGFCNEGDAQLNFDFEDRNIGFCLDKENDEVLIEAFTDIDDYGFYVYQEDVEKFVEDLKNEYLYISEGSVN